MSDQATRVESAANKVGAPEPDPGTGGAPEREQLLREIERRDEEILRLRDLLIGRDAELGAARGRLSMIEAHSQRVKGLAARIPIPGAAWIIDGLMRLVQGRRG